MLRDVFLKVILPRNAHETAHKTYSKVVENNKKMSLGISKYSVVKSRKRSGVKKAIRRSIRKIMFSM